MFHELYATTSTERFTCSARSQWVMISRSSWVYVWILVANFEFSPHAGYCSKILQLFYVFPQVIVGLWILSEVGSCCDFLTLIYIGKIFRHKPCFVEHVTFWAIPLIILESQTAVLMLHTVPILYDKYQDKVDHFAGRAHTEARKQYEVLDAKVLSKIPRGLAKPKKQN